MDGWYHRPNRPWARIEPGTQQLEAHRTTTELGLHSAIEVDLKQHSKLTWYIPIKHTT